MAITNKEKGVWGIDQVYNKQNQGSIWKYTTSGDNHELWVWGINSEGILGLAGQEGQTRYSSPVQLPGTTWRTVKGDQSAYMFVIATKTDNTLWSWGYNDYGYLGLNDRTKRSSPTQIPGTTWKSGVRGTMHSVAIKTDGTMWTWGRNQIGDLGLNQNNTINKSSPTQVPGTTWDIAKAAANRSSYATKTDGTLWSWGSNPGLLGHNNRTQYSSPVQVGTDTDWADSIIASGPGRTHYLKSDGTLYATGYGGQGGLGQNDEANRSSPAQIPGTTWKSVGSTEQATIASKTDGTLWAWGMNEYGELGQNQAEAQLGAISSPTQIPGTTWNIVSNPGLKKSIFVSKTDGTAWAWGQNYQGSLGVNVGPGTVAISSPTQIAATDGWIGAMSGCYSNAGFGLRSL